MSSDELTKEQLQIAINELYTKIKKILKLSTSESMILNSLKQNKEITPEQENVVQKLSKIQEEATIQTKKLLEDVDALNRLKKAKQLSVEVILEDFDESGLIELENLVPEDVTKIIEYNKIQTTFLNEILLLSVTNDAVGVKDISDLIYIRKIKFDQPVNIDGKLVYPIDSILFNQEIDDEININFIPVLRVLDQSGVNIDIERINTESTEKVKKMVLEFNNTIKHKQINIPSNPGVCSKIDQWDWKSGALFEKDGLTYDYFYCGEYYFDGEYQLVKFPKGMTLFHGSAILAEEAATYPVGIQYYEPERFDERLRKEYQKVPIDAAANSPYNLQQLLTQYVSIDIGWFTNGRNAMLYSKSVDDKIPGCKDFCVHAYKLKQDCVFLLLDNQYNIDKLLTHPKMTSESSDALRTMFSIKKDYKKTFNTSNNPMNVINVEPTIRLSLFGHDKAFAQWICEHVIYGNYSGYCAPLQNALKKNNSFHLEFIFCNPILYLERDLTNETDMFYDPEKYPDNIRELFNQMKKYETINTNFHSGNIFEHSIWSLMFSEHLSGRTDPEMDDRLRKVIIASALIHDIGKMHPASCTINETRKKYIYFDVVDHPKIGADYFDTGIPILDDNLMDTRKKLMPQDIIKDILPDVTEEEIDVVKNVVLFHWHFGSNILSKFNEKGSIDSRDVNNYIEIFNKSKNKHNSILATIIVSIADIEATQPYTKEKLKGLSTDEIKSLLHSKILPYIISKPKIYRGSDLPSHIKASETGIKALNKIMSTYSQNQN